MTTENKVYPPTLVTNSDSRGQENAMNGQTGEQAENLHGLLPWSSIFDELKRHRKLLVHGNLVALLAVVCAVPVPLFLPVLVDEVLLGQPGEIGRAHV